MAAAEAHWWMETWVHTGIPSGGLTFALLRTGCHHRHGCGEEHRLFQHIYRRGGNTDAKTVQFYLGDSSGPNGTWALAGEGVFGSGDMLNVDNTTKVDREVPEKFTCPAVTGRRSSAWPGGLHMESNTNG